MADRDYYQILGVARDATPDQIKKAYRGLARKYHPDVNPGDKTAETRFKEAQGAYDILSDPEKRALYDRYGRAAFEGAGAAGPRSRASEWTARQGAPGADVFDFTEFFGPGGFTAEGGPTGASAGGEGGLFDELLGRLRTGGSGGARAGRRAGQAGPRRGHDVEADITIPFLTAVQGGETTIGLVRADGQRETLSVKIPPGTEPGARLRLRGRGEPGEAGGPAGDLMVTVEVEPHRYFTRDGRNLLVDLPLTVTEAALGARVDVPTLSGFITLTVPPGTSSGQKLRLKGQGVPASGKHPAGDLFAVPKIVVPRTLDDRSKELIKEFGEHNPANPRQGLWS